MKRMDYRIDLQRGRGGTNWTVAALTERALERTPQPITFDDRPDVLSFMKESQSQGYRFSGATFIDPAEKLVKNRYFLVGPNGELTLSVEDNGPRDTVWEVGDVMQGRNVRPGFVGVIDNIFQGTGVRERFGCDLAFLLRLHRTADAAPAVSFDPAKSCPCGLHGKPYGDCCKGRGFYAPGNQMLRVTTPKFVEGALAEVQSSVLHGDTRFRIVWNGVWHYPQHETFHQFLDALVVGMLGREWFVEQLLLPIKNQNAIVKWRAAMIELLRRPGDVDDGVGTGHTLTGPAKAYQCFGYDLYWLQLVHKLPEKLIARLKDFRAFQGARYEVLVAAIFARAGFEIEWFDDDTAIGKHPEFIATHKLSGKKVGVETKSRQRPGAMNYIGTVNPETHLKGDVFELYGKAVKQAPGGDLPFLIFIDPNVPDGPGKGLTSYSDILIDNVAWMKEIRDRSRRRLECGGEP